MIKIIKPYFKKSKIRLLKVKQVGRVKDPYLLIISPVKNSKDIKNTSTRIKKFLNSLFIPYNILIKKELTVLNNFGYILLMKDYNKMKDLSLLLIKSILQSKISNLIMIKTDEGKILIFVNMKTNFKLKEVNKVYNIILTLFKLFFVVTYNQLLLHNRNIILKVLMTQRYGVKNELCFL